MIWYAHRTPTAWIDTGQFDRSFDQQFIITSNDLGEQHVRATHTARLGADLDQIIKPRGTPKMHLRLTHHEDNAVGLFQRKGKS